MAIALVSRKKFPTPTKPVRKNSLARKPGSGAGQYSPGFPGFGTPVTAFVSVPVIQTKLRMGEPSDRFEREADRMADQATRMVNTETADTGMGAVSAPGVPHIQRLCAECEEDLVQAKQVQRQVSGVRPQLEQHIRMLHNNGQPLPMSVRGDFEPHFKRDFSSVRIHTGTQAIQATQALNARAFTAGRDIVLGPGEYDPATARGRHLLAHELTHVVQQGGAAPRGVVQPAREAGSGVPALQRQAGGGTIEPAFGETASEADLQSEPYASNERLQRAFDNSPALSIGESGRAVQLLQEGLMRDGFAMPRSTKPTGELDGAFGQETFNSVLAFQRKHGLGVDGIVGHQTMGKLDELAVQPPELPCQSPEIALADTHAFFPGGFCRPLQLKSIGVTVNGDIKVVEAAFKEVCRNMTFNIVGNKITTPDCIKGLAGVQPIGCFCLCKAIFDGKHTIKLVTTVNEKREKVDLNNGAKDVELPFPVPGPNTTGDVITLWHPNVTNFSVGAFNSSGGPLPLPTPFVRILAHELCGHGVFNGGGGTKGFRKFHDFTIEIENKIAGEQSPKLPARGKFSNPRQGESFHSKPSDPNHPDPIFRLGKKNAGCSTPQDEKKCWHHEKV